MIIIPRECTYCFKEFEIHYERDDDDTYTIEPPFCPFCGAPDPDIELPEFDDDE